MTRTIKIDSKYSIGDNKPTFIIAEIGQNHQGDINIAKKMIQIAKEIGVDCVKFQKTSIKDKFNSSALNRSYSNPNSWGTTYGDHKQHLEFTNEQFLELQKFSKNIDILFTASAMDDTSLDFLHSIQVPFIKIGSGDANNIPLIKKAALMNIPLIISTGMQNLERVRRIYEEVSEFHKKFALLHCISAYPTPIKEINLNVINLYHKQFPDVPIGYSGHELGTHLTLASVALGAKIIERHFTLDKKQKGSDHICSLEPEEFKALVDNIRELEIALGEPIKKFQSSEEPCYDKLSKTIVASRFLEIGTIITVNDLKIKVAEPKGIDGSLIETIIGKILQKDIMEDESITKEDLI